MAGCKAHKKCFPLVSSVSLGKSNEMLLGASFQLVFFRIDFPLCAARVYSAKLICDVGFLLLGLNVKLVLNNKP